MLTHLLIDYNGKIIAFYTNIKGSTNDTLVASYNSSFHNILNGYFALGDPAFSAVRNHVGGFESQQVKRANQKVFDLVSRKEQILIENINNFLKHSI